MSLVQSNKLQAERQATCFVCGSENPKGLHLHYDCGVDGAVNATWTPTSICEGFRGIVHGGIVSTVLDEAMSKAVFATECQALTCELKVRFRHHVTVGEPLRISGWVVARQKRKITAEASLCTLDGKERAQAWATFLILPGTRSDQAGLDSEPPVQNEPDRASRR